MVRFARDNGNRTGTIVTLGKMRRPGILSLVTIAAGLSALAIGCTNGTGVRKANVPPVASPSDQVEIPHTLPTATAELLPPANWMRRRRRTARPISAEQCPTFRNAAEAIWTEDSGAAPVLAQFTEVKFPEAEVVPLPQGTPSEKKQSGPKSVASPSGGLSITLHADNLDIRKALEMVSRQANMNILVSPGVTGTVTLDIRDKTVDDALQAIATLCQLEVKHDRDFLYISTPKEVRDHEEEDLPVRVYRLNYVKSSDVEKMIKPLLSKNGMLTSSPDSEVGLPSDASGAAKAGGQETSKDVKGGGNSLAGGEIVVVQDYEHVLKKVDRIVAQIDVQPAQVLIEAVIVSVTLNKGLELGANFAVLDGAGNTLGVLGNGSLINAATGFAPAAVLAAAGTANNTTTTTTTDSSKGTSRVTTTTTGTTGGLSSGFGANTNGVKFGWVGGSTTGFIQALETLGETKVLAAPRLLVLNKQRAEVHVGKQLGYATSTQTQTSTTETVNFMPVGTQLRLRPFISSDGMIRMEIHPERSDGDIESGIPQTNAQQVTTNVMVPDGATIVIGGLIDSEVTHGWAGIPLLSRLPWIGYLFRDTSDSTVKNELIVILTPHIWHPECPEATNYLGRPRAQGLDTRTAQKPCEDRRDGLSLYELTRPEGTCPAPSNHPSPDRVPVEARHEAPADDK